MNLQELKDKFYTELAGVFISDGFKYLKSKGRFERLDEGIRYSYAFIFHSRTNEVAIESFIYIEHQETERIYKKATGHTTSSTIGNEVGKIIRNPDGLMKDFQSMDLIIETSKDLIKAIDQVVRVFYEVAIPYYNTFNSLDAIDRVLNDEPDTISVHANAQFFRVPKGLITAHLRDRQDLETLLAKYDEKMNGVSDLFQDRYESIKEHLKFY